MTDELSIGGVVFILYRRGEVLMEWRGNIVQDLEATWFYPAGSIDDGERAQKALRREMGEELGCKPVSWFMLAPVLRPAGTRKYRMRPYVVTRWEGEVPSQVRDTGATLSWISIEEALGSPIPVIREMTLSMIETAVALPRAVATQEEIDLVRNEGECLVTSYTNLLEPDLPDEKQDPEWHDGKKLIALADRLEATHKEEH